MLFCLFYLSSLTAARCHLLAPRRVLKLQRGKSAEEEGKGIGRFLKRAQGVKVLILSLSTKLFGFVYLSVLSQED